MYDLYADDIFRYLFVHVRDKEVAEDLTADTFMKAWKSISTFDFKQPRPWLYKIARNLLTDHWRKKKPFALDENIEIVSEENLEANLDKKLTQEQVQAAISKLPPKMQSVVAMRFILRYSARKTADSLQITEGSVRVIQYRALQKMKGLL